MQTRLDLPPVVTCVRVGDRLAALCDVEAPPSGTVVRVRFLNGREGHCRTGEAFAGKPAPVVRSEWLQDVRDCPLCNEGADRALPRFSIPQLFWRVLVAECDRCGLLYKSAVPTGRLVRLIYSSQYVHFAGAEADLRTLASRVSRLGPPAGRHLDYGCGRGDFVRAAALAGWDSIGVDPFLATSSATKERLPPRLLRFDAADGAPPGLGLFDIISAWAVVEHLPQPLATFRGLVRLLRPGGRLIFNSPSGASLAARWSGPSWRMATLLEHLQFFTPRSIRWLARELGLGLIRVRRAGNPFPLGVARGTADQGLSDLPIEAPSIPGYDAGAAAAPAPSVLGQFRRRILTGRSGGPVATLLRAGVHHLRLGDHLEVTLSRRKTA